MKATELIVKLQELTKDGVDYDVVVPTLYEATGFTDPTQVDIVSYLEKNVVKRRIEIE